MDMTVGDFITRVRANAGLTQAAVAELRGVTRTAQVRAETVEANPAITTLVDIVSRLGHSLELVATSNETGVQQRLVLVAPCTEFWDEFLARPESHARRMARAVFPTEPLDALLLRDLIVSVAESYRDSRTRVTTSNRYILWPNDDDEPILLDRRSRMVADLEEIRGRLGWVEVSVEKAGPPAVIDSDDLLFGFGVAGEHRWTCSESFQRLTADPERLRAVIRAFAEAVDATPDLLLGDFR